VAALPCFGFVNPAAFGMPRGCTHLDFHRRGPHHDRLVTTWETQRLVVCLDTQSLQVFDKFPTHLRSIDRLKSITKQSGRCLTSSARGDPARRICPCFTPSSADFDIRNAPMPFSSGVRVTWSFAPTMSCNSSSIPARY